MNSSDIDWAALERMRRAFLEGRAGSADYWTTEKDLASYDATYAQRIGWKWDFVLSDLARIRWTPPAGELSDWGCGSGVAGRAMLDAFGAGWVRELRLFDRSALATQFAARRARERFPGLQVVVGSGPPVGTVLISHVLTELDATQERTLTDALVASATCVIWVEPGTYETSRRLVEIRERLRNSFQIAAPCTHQAACGLRMAENEPHWCHHFAQPPSAVFTDPAWGKFSQLTQIDLRSLPLSYLVLDRRPLAPKPPHTARLIGRPRVYKPHALLLCCDESGVRDRAIAKRDSPQVYRAAKKGEIESLWSLESGS